MTRSSERRPGTRILAIVLGVVGVATIALGGTALAAYKYDVARLERFMPGVEVAGVSVGDMTRSEALNAVGERLERQLTRPITVKAGNFSWKTTSSELGTRPEVAESVDQALGVGNSYSWIERVYHRITDEPVNATYDVGYALDFSTVEAFIAEAAGEVGQPAVTGGFAIQGNDLVYEKSKDGRELNSEVAVRRLREALRADRNAVTVPIRVVHASDAEDQYTIVIRLGQNRLYLYKGRKLVKTYPVATGSPGFPTPAGSFEIVSKVKNPSWTNPDPSGWGSGMPAFIPGGPGSPLGTRALYLNAPGIRIHGTSDTGSIGTYASHGCIRMLMPDVEQLYDIVPVGTPALILT